MAETAGVSKSARVWANGAAADNTNIKDAVRKRILPSTDIGENDLRAEERA
jgi:predicted Rdx family selenoprotein